MKYSNKINVCRPSESGFVWSIAKVRHRLSCWTQLPEWRTPCSAPIRSDMHRVSVEKGFYSKTWMAFPLHFCRQPQRLYASCSQRHHLQFGTVQIKPILCHQFGTYFIDVVAEQFGLLISRRFPSNFDCRTVNLRHLHIPGRRWHWRSNHVFTIKWKYSNHDLSKLPLVEQPQQLATKSMAKLGWFWMASAAEGSFDECGCFCHCLLFSFSSANGTMLDLANVREKVLFSAKLASHGFYWPFGGLFCFVVKLAASKWQLVC